VNPVGIAARGILIADRREALRLSLLPVIPKSQNFVWEVGCGHGHFLTAYAAANPGQLCVGIDISADRVERAGRKVERAKLKNVHFLLADADDFLVAMPEGPRISAVFVLFPDPWPKRRHHKNRVIRPEFLSAIATKADKGAAFYFRTDYEPYFRDVVSIARAHADWIEADGEAWPFEEPTVFQKRADRHFTFVARRG
jgi:tRNA (guanine-N7-)-methyltransferase